MNVLFEFLSEEPIENMITCMNYQLDKVIFIGYHNLVKEYQKSAETYLKEHCDVKEVSFSIVPETDLTKIIKIMRGTIEEEISKENTLFFDVTGGSSLVLVAFGILSKDYDTPMHIFSIKENRLIELEEGSKRNLSIVCPKRPLILTLDRLIELRGGKINYYLQKDSKTADDPEFLEDIRQIWKVARKNETLWNPFSDFLRTNLVPDGNLYVEKPAKMIVSALRGSNSVLRQPIQLNSILDDLAHYGVLKNLVHINGKYAFTMKSHNVKNCLWEGGSILELMTFLEERSVSDDCRVGVHLDWDGIIHHKPGEDVLNEIDVLTLQGLIPTFISCKSGRMSSSRSLNALYELSTVSSRFGGIYAKKILVVTQPIAKVYQKRAEEMGIEIRFAST